MRRQHRDEGYHPHAEVRGHSAFSFFHDKPPTLGDVVRKPHSLAKEEMFQPFCSVLVAV